MRQTLKLGRASLAPLACAALLAACGGGGGGGNAEGKLQVISFTYPGGATVKRDVALQATATSGLPVTFRSGTPSICEVVGSTVRSLMVGECLVVASQEGGTSADGVRWARADDTSHLFRVLKNPQTVAFTPPGYLRTTDVLEVPLVSTASSGLPVSYSVTTPTVCAIEGSTLKLLGKGACAVAATQAGDDEYLPQTTQRFVAVDPLIVSESFDPAGAGLGTNSSIRTNLAGGVSVNAYSFNTIKPQSWESCPAAAGDWCYQEIAADGSLLTSALRMPSADYPGWDNANNRVDIFAPGITGLAWNADTPGGLQVTTETVLGFVAGVNAELAAEAMPFVVELVLSKNGGDGCFLTVSTARYPKAGDLQAWGIPLGHFALTQKCNQSSLASVSLEDDVRKLPNHNGRDAAEELQNTLKFEAELENEKFKPARDAAALLLQQYPIVQVRIRAMDLQRTRPSTTTTGVQYWKNDLTVGGLILIQ